MASLYESQELGLYGSINTKTTTPVTGVDCFRIDVLTDAVFSTLTDSLASGDSLTGVTLAAGRSLRGKFSAYTLTSGAVRAYKSGKLSA